MHTSANVSLSQVMGLAIFAITLALFTSYGAHAGDVIDMNSRLKTVSIAANSGQRPQSCARAMAPGGFAPESLRVRFARSFRSFRRIEAGKEIILPPLVGRRWIIVSRTPEMVEAMQSPTLAETNDQRLFVTSFQELDELMSLPDGPKSTYPLAGGSQARSDLNVILKSHLWIDHGASRAAVHKFMGRAVFGEGSAKILAFHLNEALALRGLPLIHVFDYDGEEI